MIKNLILVVVIMTFTFCSNKNKDYIITLKTSKGDIKIYLYDETPQHKENFIQLAESGMYDGVLFHRVIKDFMIQTGDPASRKGGKSEKADSIAKSTVPAEFNKQLFHEKGAVAAARLGDEVNPEKASSGSQFYIVQGQKFTKEQLTVNQNMLIYYFRQLLADSLYQDLLPQVQKLQTEGNIDSLQSFVLSYKDTIEEKFDVDVDIDFPEERVLAYTSVGGAPHLDDEYTVFGKVVEGLEVVDEIGNTPLNGIRPQEDIWVEKVDVDMVNKKKIEKMYGIPFKKK